MSYGDFIIIDAKDCMKVKIRFVDTGTYRIVQAGAIRNGRVRDPYRPIYHNRGFLGDGHYNSHVHKELFRRWVKMISRCYDSKDKDFPRYGLKGIVVASTWFNFQNYASWVHSNLLDIGKDLDDLKLFHIDKDLKSGPIKTYGPDTCTLLTIKENSSMTTPRKSRKITLVSPEGKLVCDEISNLCRDFKLTRSKVYKLINKTASHHKGWKLHGA